MPTQNKLDRPRNIKDPKGYEFEDKKNPHQKMGAIIHQHIGDAMNNKYMPDSHLVNVGVANDTGSINAAVIFNHIFFWIKNNKGVGTIFSNGHTWMYGPIAGIAAHFPYFTEKQVKTALRFLLKYNYIIKDKLNSSECDQTNWYALYDEKWTRLESPKLSDDMEDEPKKSFRREPVGPMPEREEEFKKSLRREPVGPVLARSSSKYTGISTKSISEGHSTGIYTKSISEGEKDKERKQCRGASRPPEPDGSRASDAALDSKKAKKAKKPEEPVERAPGVYTTHSEHSKLMAKEPEDIVQEGYVHLSEWKADQPPSRRRGSDYRKMLKWGLSAAIEDRVRKKRTEKLKGQLHLGNPEEIAKNRKIALWVENRLFTNQRYSADAKEDKLAIYALGCAGNVYDEFAYNSPNFREMVGHHLRKGGIEL